MSHRVMGKTRKNNSQKNQKAKKFYQTKGIFFFSMWNVKFVLDFKGITSPFSFLPPAIVFLKNGCELK